MLGLLIQLVFAATVVLVPLLGAWVASSLAAYANGPIWLAPIAGLVLFPIGPVAWELWANARRAATGRAAAPKLLLHQRLILRTLAVSALVLGVNLAVAPATVFTALSTRGDWVLDGREEPWAGDARAAAFAAADQLEWAYNAVLDNPFESYADGDAAPSPPPVAGPPLPQILTATGAPALHPLIAALPKSVESSVESVGRYIAARELDPVQRVKAVHDYVADRVAYDVDAERAGTYPPQDAETVFTARRAVCAGYARLFTELMRAAGGEAVSIVGQARALDRGIGGAEHAWNAVEIAGGWYLLDVTWDAGIVSGSTFEKRYATTYFLASPEVFGLSHFPDEAAWQLRAEPLSRGAFMRQPMLTPEFFVHQLTLVSPVRSQMSAPGGALSLAVESPSGVALFATWSSPGTDPSKGTSCAVTRDGSTSKVLCRLPDSGTQRVTLFVARDADGEPEYVEHLEAQGAGP